MVGTIERRPEEQTLPLLGEAQKENDYPKKRHALIAGCHINKKFTATWPNRKIFS
jgi:hypothetical protein